ncbi:MAG: hypothetical protein DMG05_15410 [Acidobacteria bacterium]|nr:MAG: hypothetical protein DMG05_15410 [Acidobacteriota bacterium]
MTILAWLRHYKGFSFLKPGYRAEMNRNRVTRNAIGIIGLVGIWLGAFFPEPCLGAEIAYLRNGRTLVIQTHEVVGSKIILTLDGSDRLEFDKDWVESFVPLESPPTPLDQDLQQDSAARQYTVRELKEIIHLTAQKHQLDENLLASIIAVESNFNPGALSVKGAQGLMQLMPETAATYKVKNVFDARENVEAGAKYLKDLLHQFNQNVTLALAAYNAGPSTVANYKGVPPFQETQAYIRKVVASKLIPLPRERTLLAQRHGAAGEEKSQD